MTSLPRTPPHNYEAEQAVLGAILLDNRSYERVADFLKPEHFADPGHARVFAACIRRIGDNRRADPVTLGSELATDQRVADLGPGYLAQLATACPSIVSAGDYGRQIYDLHLRRELIAIAEQTLTDAYDTAAGQTAEQVREGLEASISTIAEVGTSGEARTADDVGAAFIEQFDRSCRVGGAGVLTGLTDFDAKTGGLHPSDLNILAGRPSMGKTALAIALMQRLAERHAAREGGCPVGMFSLEMSAEQVFARMASEEGGIAYAKFRDGSVTPAQQLEVIEGAQRLRRLPILIDDTAGITIGALRTRARRMKRRYGVGVIIVDYLQLVGGDSRPENRVQEVSAITRGLKGIAKELDITVIALSQLSRAVEQREDKRPMLSDLRESGSIEQDADAVWFAYRDQYYLERAEPAQRPEESADKFNDRLNRWTERMTAAVNVMEVLLAKQRHGPVGTVRLAFFAETNTVNSLAQGE